VKAAQVRRVIDAFAAQAIKRANEAPDGDRKAEAEARAVALARMAAEPDDELGPVLTREQARAELLRLGWRG
jgi:hypothetical protein